jgi:tetratricopeptide (TPR) repeat protein
VIAVCFLAVALAWSSVALAQSRKDRRKALAHYKQGEAYMKVEAFDKAVEEYLAAYAIVPKAGFLFNIGLAYQKAKDKKKALEYFRRYLKEDPRGVAREEAKAYATVLEREIAKAEAEAADAARMQREAEEKKKRARSHAEAAAKHRNAEKYDKAIAELSAAFEADPDPEYVYQQAEVHRIAGDKPAAIAQYERYRALAPTGPRSADVLQKKLRLETEVAEAARPKPKPGVGLTQPVAGVEKKKKKGGLDWHWVAVGAALIAAGVIGDTAPSNASNGELDGTDFIPVGCYGVGGLFLIAGFF